MGSELTDCTVILLVYGCRRHQVWRLLVGCATCVLKRSGAIVAWVLRRRSWRSQPGSQSSRRSRNSWYCRRYSFTRFSVPVLTPNSGILLPNCRLLNDSAWRASSCSKNNFLLSKKLRLLWRLRILAFHWMFPWSSIRGRQVRNEGLIPKVLARVWLGSDGAVWNS